MSDALDGFFAAWSETDATARRAAIDAAMAQNFIYSDPRSDERITTLDALADYVGQFSTNAPGWTAAVADRSTINGLTRAFVAFGGKGPDGSDMTQMGTYFADSDDTGKITLLAGFVGAGAPE